MKKYAFRVYELGNNKGEIIVSVSTLEEARKMRDFYATKNPNKKYAIEKVEVSTK